MLFSFSLLPYFTTRHASLPIPSSGPFIGLLTPLHTASEEPLSSYIQLVVLTCYLVVSLRETSLHTLPGGEYARSPLSVTDLHERPDSCLAPEVAALPENARRPGQT